MRRDLLVGMHEVRCMWHEAPPRLAGHVAGTQDRVGDVMLPHDEPAHLLRDPLARVRDDRLQVLTFQTHPMRRILLVYSIAYPTFWGNVTHVSRPPSHAPPSRAVAQQ